MTKRQALAQLRARVLLVLLIMLSLLTIARPVRADDGGTLTFVEPSVELLGVEMQVVRVWPVEPGGTMTFVVQSTVDGLPAPTTLLTVTPACPYTEERGVSEGCARAIAEVPKFWPSGIDGRATIAIPIADDILSTGADAVMVATVTYGLPRPIPPEFEGHRVPYGWYHGSVTVQQPILPATPELVLP